MTNQLHARLALALDRKLREKRVVVFYDPREEFGPFLDELREVGEGVGGLPRVALADTLAHLARFRGSFFSLKAEVEPIMALPKPDPLLVYIPGHGRDAPGRLRSPRASQICWNVLLELETAGTFHEPSLRSMARNELRRSHTDGQIDELLPARGLSWQEAVSLLEQEKPSVLKLVFGEGRSEDLISRWLASDAHDARLEERQAVPELRSLVRTRLGLHLDPDMGLPKARHHSLRYVLVNEFRWDLGAASPEKLAMVPVPPDKDSARRVRDVAARLRQDHGAAYVEMADRVEGELGLASMPLDPGALGAIDTFRFEERALLSHAAEQVTKGRYEAALEIVSVRRGSFWVHQDMGQLGQWETCRLLAELGAEVKRVQALVKKAGSDAGAWVDAYATDWFKVDRAQRALEAWVARLEDEPERCIEEALGLVRRDHEVLLEAMAQGWSRALGASGWSAKGALHQTSIYPELVAPLRGRVAWFWVDALRYEMGADLLEQLKGALDLRILPAVAALPTITPIGMAALLPGSSSAFSVVEHGDKLAARVEGVNLVRLDDRMKLLKALRPDAKDLDLGDLLQKSQAALRRATEGAELLVVRSQAIDGVCELDGGLIARQIMDTVVGNVARAVRKLAGLGFEGFVITSDHGHQFSLRKAEDMHMEKPGGQTVELHRRCWAGRGGSTPSAAVRVSGAELGYDTDLDFIFPKGLAVFKAGGGLAFHHGGTSLQEMVVPVVVLRMEESGPAGGKKPEVQLEGFPTELTNRTFGMRITLPAQLFDQEVVPVKLLLLSGEREVGRLGMAIDSGFDRRAGTVEVPPGKPVNVAMVLMDDTADKLRIAALDPTTDALLAQSPVITVKLGM